MVIDRAGRIAAVIVTYNNAQGLSLVLGDLRCQSRPPDTVIVVDNSSKGISGPAVEAQYPGARYVRPCSNIGSAGGYYEGLQRAIPSHEFVLTLDDDVRIPRDTVERLQSVFTHASSGVQPGAVCCVLNRSRGTGIEATDAFPWKGTLFRTDAIQKAGLPLSDYFMYAEDLEYALRLQSAGYILQRVNDCVITETRMNKETVPFITFYHDPFRLYYAFRNELHTWLRYRNYRQVLRMFMYGGKVIAATLFSRPRSSLAVALGLKDGFCARLGMNPRFPASGTAQ
jgi:GT2 family glycosyltransferase